MSKAVTIKIYTKMAKTFVEFESGTWAMTEMVMTRLDTWERKILRCIRVGAVRYLARPGRKQATATKLGTYST
jgi:hypothetical protein